ncbi:hypothetical protein B0T22DRAFT_436608 [Podospora appendiculata]|uniref:2EXR domain-containing protein n=1 Tax=Podospora appendiculata TaxID=314037 RepID=A0AAE0XHA2_9PEZI|nr:hypothetical protein B0T22DRAFT_436608 [Podospora appendiculata]
MQPTLHPDHWQPGQAGTSVDTTTSMAWRERFGPCETLSHPMTSENRTRWSDIMHESLEFAKSIYEPDCQFLEDYVPENQDDILIFSRQLRAAGHDNDRDPADDAFFLLDPSPRKCAAAAAAKLSFLSPPPPYSLVPLQDSMSPSSSSSNNQRIVVRNKFQKFPRLPGELQNKIWLAAVPPIFIDVYPATDVHGNVVMLVGAQYSRGFSAPEPGTTWKTRANPLYTASSESRSLAIHHFGRRGRGCVPFSKASDTLVIRTHLYGTHYWASGIHPLIPAADLARAQNVVLKATCSTSRLCARPHSAGTQRLVGFLGAAMPNLRHLTVLANESDNCAHYQPRALGLRPKYRVQGYDSAVHSSYSFWVASVLSALERLAGGARTDTERREGRGYTNIPFRRLEGFHFSLRVGENGFPLLCSGLKPSSMTETPDGSGTEGSKENPVYHQPYYIWEMPGARPDRAWFADPEREE